MMAMLFLLLFELSIIFGFLLDLLLADPEKLPHPVVIIGKGITFLEKHLRQIFPETQQGRRTAGAVMAALIPVTTFIVTAGACILAWIIHPIVFFLLHTLWCWQAVAIRGLAKEAKNVYRCLAMDDGGPEADATEQGPEAETLICYSMVNTLCRNTGMKRVRFFFEGEQVETVAGTIYWAGEFMYNIGLAEKGLG